MCVHAHFDSYVKAYYFAQTPSPKCTILLSRNTFLLDLRSWSVWVFPSITLCRYFPRPWWMLWLIAPRCTVVILPPPYKPPSSTSQPHSTSSPSLSPVCWNMWALGQGSSAYVFLFLRGTAFFPSSCNSRLQERGPCHPIKLQKDLNSATWLAYTVDAVVTGSCKNLEKHCTHCYWPHCYWPWLYSFPHHPQPAFTLNSAVSYDARTQAMNLIKTLPLEYLMAYVYPHLYALHLLTEKVPVVSLFTACLQTDKNISTLRFLSVCEF